MRRFQGWISIGLVLPTLALSGCMTDEGEVQPVRYGKRSARDAGAPSEPPVREGDEQAARETAAQPMGDGSLATIHEDGASQRQGNVFGVNLGWIPGWDTTGTVRLLGLASHLVGDWGYIRHGFSPTDDVEACRRSMAMIRAHHLIPIAGGAYPDPSFREEGHSYPRLDSEGTMRSAARAKARVWQKMYDADIPFYAIEVMNEINIGDGWPAEKYAQWLYDLAAELSLAYPGLKICSCGMAGSGKEYYDEMLAVKPELADVVDFWGLHPYGANHPPEYKPEGTSLRSYEETKEVLAKYGIDPIRLMCTETGYELEHSDTGKDPKYPPIREDNRAEYMARAFRDYYVPEPTIECVCIFQLWDFPWHNWNGWDLMFHDGRPRPMYESVAAEPKPQGHDWMVTGPCHVTGRITWRDTEIGVPRVVVYTEPGLYGGVTDDEGYYEILDLPTGEYEVTAFRDGYTSVGPRTVNVTKDKPGRLDASVHRVSLIPARFGDPADAEPRDKPPGWAPYGDTDEAGVFQIDHDVTFADRNTQRITVGPDQSAGLLTFGAYSSAYPSEVFLADIYVRSEDAKNEEDGGPFLELALTNGRGEPTTLARVIPNDFVSDGQWHRITAALYGPPRSTRVRIAFGAEKTDGTFWFSEPFVGEADFPLPGDVDYRTTGYVPPLYELNKRFFAQAVTDISRRNPDLETGTVTGQVLDFRGRPLAHATVSSDSPVFCTVTDEEGGYELTLPANTSVSVRALALGEIPAVSELVRVGPGESTSLDLQTAPPPAPETLVNPGFNITHPTEPGLMTGWTGFGTTDGIIASGHEKIVVYDKAFSYEGDGLYFAQSGSNTKNGGAFQMIKADPGATYRISGRVFTYTHGESKKPMDNNCRIGIDPTGGRDPESPDIVWTEAIESEEEWTQVSTEAVAETERITVFIHHQMRRANYWNLCMFDDVQLEKTAAAAANEEEPVTIPLTGP